MSERKEAWMRILIGIISGIILGLWKSVVQVISLVHWCMVVITGSRNKDLSEFVEIWNTQMYIYLKYMTFVTNIRPFPFNKIEKSMSKFKKS